MSKDYSGTPLSSKLGIKPGSKILLVNVPNGFLDALGPLSADVAVRDDAALNLDVIVLFVMREIELQDRFSGLAEKLAPAGGLWIAWPKKAAKMPTDLSFETVQRIGLDAGLVDNKSCSINEIFQGLRFVVRVKDRH